MFVVRYISGVPYVNRSTKNCLFRFVSKTPNFQELQTNKSVVFFCTDSELGIMKYPIDSHPFNNVVIKASARKVSKHVSFVYFSIIFDVKIVLIECFFVFLQLIDFKISENGHYLFTISENSYSMLIWKLYPKYLSNCCD